MIVRILPMIGTKQQLVGPVSTSPQHDIAPAGAGPRAILRVYIDRKGVWSVMSQ
jgi:hypothetical protein